MVSPPPQGGLPGEDADEDSDARTLTNVGPVTQTLVHPITTM